MTRDVQRWLLALLIFLGGAAAGLATEHAFILHHHRSFHSHNNGIDHEAALASLTKELHLTTAQRDSVVAIFHRHQPAADSAWAAINKHFAASIDSVHRDMMRVFTPEQQREFRAWVHRHH